VVSLGAQKHTDANKAVLRRHFEEVLNVGRLHVVDELYSEDYVLDAPFGSDGTASGDSVTSGREGLKERVRLFRTAFPDIAFTVEEMLAEDEAVAARYVFRGTHLGPFGDVPATGRPMCVTGILVAHFRSGAISEAFSAFDSGDMMRQLGASAHDKGSGNDDQRRRKMKEPTGLFKEYLDAFESRQFGRVHQLYTEDCELFIPNFAEAHGHEQLKDFFTFQTAPFPDCRFEIRHWAEYEDGFFAEMNFIGTNTGPLPGPGGTVPPTHRKVNVPFVSIFTVRDGQIATHHGYIDQLDLLGQLGLFPPPGAPPA
jgi:steroid delta-isomerase-like uncharacterized protein